MVASEERKGRQEGSNTEKERDRERETEIARERESKSRKGQRRIGRGRRRARAGESDRCSPPNPPGLPPATSCNPRSSGGGRHGGACKSAWRRDALPRPSPARSTCIRAYVHTGGRVCTGVCAYLARMYAHHRRNQSIDRATDRPTGKQTRRDTG